METVIRRKLTGKLMMKIFNKERSIRNFKISGNEKYTKVHNSYWYEITVRHNENENGGKVFDNLRKTYK